MIFLIYFLVSNERRYSQLLIKKKNNNYYQGECLITSLNATASRLKPGTLSLPPLPTPVATRAPPEKETKQESHNLSHGGSSPRDKRPMHCLHESITETS